MNLRNKKKKWSNCFLVPSSTQTASVCARHRLTVSHCGWKRCEIARWKCEISVLMVSHAVCLWEQRVGQSFLIHFTVPLLQWNITFNHSVTFWVTIASSTFILRLKAVHGSCCWLCAAVSHAGPASLLMCVKRLTHAGDPPPACSGSGCGWCWLLMKPPAMSGRLRHRRRRRRRHNRQPLSKHQ